MNKISTLFKASLVFVGLLEIFASYGLFKSSDATIFITSTLFFLMFGIINICLGLFADRFISKLNIVEVYVYAVSQFLVLNILSFLLDKSFGIQNIFGFIISLIFSIYIIKSVKDYLLNPKSLA